MAKEQSTVKKAVKITAISLAALIGAFILIVLIYVIYVAAQYYRIGDNLALEVKNGQTQSISAGEEYTVISYNLGFGAYSPEYSFFMDEGVMKDGKKVAGKYAKGMNKADVEKNVSGQAELIGEQNADFYFLQEADEKADRSYHINMVERMTAALPSHASIYAENFHTANLIYPFNDPIGKTDAGILTLSRYRVQSAVRRSFPITKNFIDKLFDLDRCFSVQYLPVEGSDKFLTLINLHMSAYDKGGTIRAKQLEMLNAVLKEERDKGNYIVAGGDFNHCLIADQFESDEAAFAAFKSEQVTPDWVKSSVLHERELTEGYRIAANKEKATCRGADIPYTVGVNFETVIDGFLYSDNIEVVREETVDTGYAFSDHNPVKMSFRLR